MAGNDDDDQRDDGGRQKDGEKMVHLSFSYRSKVLQVRLQTNATLMELGQQLVSASGVAPHTLRLLVPRAPALLPFSPLHSSLLISQSGITEGRVIIMMGALPEEIQEVSQGFGSAFERTTIGFSEEDKRAKIWRSSRAGTSRRLPEGEYIFCDFRTLQLPGVELNPPAVKAMEIMHKLASDRGIVAIMNKHRWRVGVMTEMAPVGYVGISPECILGYNKNQGEEISLRLRTDDLKGFRKYESIKQTLLHELAHMVHSKHDANFHALNKQLNEEATVLDWTKSGGHSLGGFRSSSGEEDEEPIDVGGVFTGVGQRLGGSKEHNALNATSAAASAAFSRRSSNNSAQADNGAGQEIDIIAEGNEVDKQVYDSENVCSKALREPDEACASVVDEKVIEPSSKSIEKKVHDLIPGPGLDMDDLQDLPEESAPIDDSFGSENMPNSKNILGFAKPVAAGSAEIDSDMKESCVVTSSCLREDELDSSMDISGDRFTEDIADSAGEDLLSLKSMQEFTERVCQRLQVAIATLKEEASASEVAATVEILFKILRNIKEHPQEDKFKRLRKTNAVFQDRVARFKGAMEVLHAVGFSDGPCDGTDAADCLILKRNDPVLLWLAQTSLEASIA